jgi:hypothetical protein
MYAINIRIGRINKQNIRSVPSSNNFMLMELSEVAVSFDLVASESIDTQNGPNLTYCG